MADYVRNVFYHFLILYFTVSFLK